MYFFQFVDIYISIYILCSVFSSPCFSFGSVRKSSPCNVEITASRGIIRVIIFIVFISFLLCSTYHRHRLGG